MQLNNSEIKKLISIIEQSPYRPLKCSDQMLLNKLRVVAKSGVASRGEVYAAIDSERDYQENLGPDRTDGHRNFEGYLVMLQYYLRKAEDAWTKNAGNLLALEEIRKIAGIAVQCMEEHGAPFRRT